MKNLSEKFNNKGVGGKRVEIPKEDDTIYTEFCYSYPGTW